MKTGILFDLDGTLLNTLEDLLDATNYALNVCGFPPRTLAQLRQAVGNGAANQIRRSLPEGTPEDTVQRVLSIYKPYYTTHCQIKTQAYPGIPQALAALQQDHPIAIVSNKPDAAVKTLCAQYFPGVYALGETPDCPRKPAPDMVLRALKAIGADNGIYVGDSEVDVVTARNAGMPCVSVLWGFRDREDIEAAGGSCFCSSPGQLPQVIQEVNHGQ